MGPQAQLTEGVPNGARSPLTTSEPQEPSWHPRGRVGRRERVPGTRQGEGCVPRARRGEGGTVRVGVRVSTVRVHLPQISSCPFSHPAEKARGSDCT